MVNYKQWFLPKSCSPLCGEMIKAISWIKGVLMEGDTWDLWVETFVMRCWWRCCVHWSVIHVWHIDRLGSTLVIYFHLSGSQLDIVAISRLSSLFEDLRSRLEMDLSSINDNILAVGGLMMFILLITSSYQD